MRILDIYQLIQIPDDKYPHIYCGPKYEATHVNIADPANQPNAVEVVFNGLDYILYNDMILRLTIATGDVATIQWVHPPFSYHIRMWQVMHPECAASIREVFAGMTDE